MELVDMHLASVQVMPEFQEKYLPAIQNTLCSVAMLSAELKCQRSVYEIDDTVHAGQLFDESRMIDVKFTDQADDENKEEEAVVKCIISRGWVRRSYGDFEDIHERLCKARVLVSIQPRSIT